MRRVFPFSVAVGFVAFGCTIVAVYTHGSVTVVSMERATGFIHRNLFGVHSETITLCIAVREQTSL